MRPYRIAISDIIAMSTPLRTQGSYAGDITGIAGLDEAKAGDISFFDNSRLINDPVWEKKVQTTQASVLLLPESFALEPRADQLHIFVKKPSIVLAKIAAHVEQLQSPRPTPLVHPSAVIDRDAQIHPDAYIGPMCYVGAHAQVHKGAVVYGGCYIGPYAIVGAETELKPRVTLLHGCTIGARCIVHSGAVIGSDGYGFEFMGGKFQKIPQIGNVVVEDDVEIGANTTIDRARLGQTVIGQGTKIDNLVQIAHNVKVGKHCLLVGQCGIAGGTVLEDYVIVGGQAGVAGHLRIGTQTKIGGQAGVNSSQGPGLTLSGQPAMELNQTYRIEVLKRKLPELYKRVAAIEEKIKSTETK